MSRPTPVLSAPNVIYYHQNDETAFFEWLARISCVEKFDGVGCDLFIRLRRIPNKHDLQELLAFFYRYNIDMRQLRQFESARNKVWFNNRNSYWYQRVFELP